MPEAITAEINGRGRDYVDTLYDAHDVPDNVDSRIAFLLARIERGNRGYKQPLFMGSQGKTLSPRRYYRADEETKREFLRELEGLISMEEANHQKDGAARNQSDKE